MFKYTEIFTDLKYINISTLPLKLCFGVDQKNKNKHQIVTLTEYRKNETEKFIISAMEPLLGVSHIIFVMLNNYLYGDLIV